MDENEGGDRNIDPSPEETTPASSSVGPVRRYTEAAVEEKQPRITDLIPVRPWHCCLILILSLCAAAAVQAAYARAFLWHPGNPEAVALAPLNVEGYGTLFTFLGSAVLGLSVGFCLMIYRVRRHKVDDYRARYRIWIWAGAAVTFAAIENATGIHRIATGWMDGVLPAAIRGDSPVFWTVALGVPLLALAIRLAVEVRSCRWAVSLMGTAILFLMAGMTQKAGLAVPLDHVLAPLVLSSLTLAGYLAAFEATVVYLRFVYLDSQDKLPQRVSRPAKTKQESTVEPASSKMKRSEGEPDPSIAERPRKGGLLSRGRRRVRVDAQHDTPTGPTPTERPVKQATTRKPATRSKSTEPSRPKANTMEPTNTTQGNMGDDHEETDGRKLSKAERRRLRKEKRRRKEQEE